MRDYISSVGLVYAYLNGYQEGDTLVMQPVDTYRYMADDFYQKVMEIAAMADQERDQHIFLILGEKERVFSVYEQLCQALKENFQRVIDGKPLQKSLKCLDGPANALFRCVQEFFCECPAYFPIQIEHDCEDYALAGIYSAPSPKKVNTKTVNALLSLWLEREAPFLSGRQMMIRSFHLRGLVGRRVVACIPQVRTGNWSLIFEGGHQLVMDEELTYVQRAPQPDELGAFSSSNVQTVLMDPTYAYGQHLYPSDLCEEWHKVFLYLCAISECEWDITLLSNVYEQFFTFLRDYICETINVEAAIPKQQFWQALLNHVQSFRNFLRGEDEPVISKDLHQTINCRYVYLPYIWSLVPHKEEGNAFSLSVLHRMVKEAMNAQEADQKGKLWEDATAYALQSVSGWQIKGRRVKTKAQEIDISVANISLDGALWRLGAYILVECKNWSGPATLQEIRGLAHISNMKGNQTALLFSAKGITQDARREIDRLAAEGLSILCVTADELLALQSASDLRALILKKWMSLQNAVDIAAMI